MKKTKILLLICALFLSLETIHAKEINNFTAKANDSVLAEDTYNASVALAGETIDIKGTIKGITLAAGNEITLDGETDYSVLAGNTININGIINNDSIIAGNTITINDTANFKRDTIIAATDIEIKGNFDRNIIIYGNKVTIKNSNIKGNIKIYAPSITVEKDTNIEGTLYYPNDSTYKAQEGAIINKIEKTKAIQTTEDNYLNTISSKVLSFLCLALVFAAISIFIPKVLTRINEKYQTLELSETIEIFTKGLVLLILVPIIATLLCCTIIGVPLGIIIITIYALAIYLSTIFTAYLIGYKIWQKTFNKEAHILLPGLIGLFILLILGLIPGISILISIITTLVGLGLIFESFKK